jgi:hypothetical protein
MSSTKRFKATYQEYKKVSARGFIEVGAEYEGEIGDLVISLHAVQSFGTRKAVHVRFRTLHEGCHKRAEILGLVKIYRLNGRGAEEVFDDPCIVILASFIPDLLESFGEIMVVCNWMTFLMRR